MTRLTRLTISFRCSAGKESTSSFSSASNTAPRWRLRFSVVTMSPRTLRDEISHIHRWPVALKDNAGVQPGDVAVGREHATDLVIVGKENGIVDCGKGLQACDHC